MRAVRCDAVVWLGAPAAGIESGRCRRLFRTLIRSTDVSAVLRILIGHAGNPALARSKRNYSSHRVVRRNANRDTVAWNNLYTEAPHAAAQLCQDLLSGITLHAVQSAAVYRLDGSLHIDQIVFAQTHLTSHEFCHTGA